MKVVDKVARHGISVHIAIAVLALAALAAIGPGISPAWGGTPPSQKAAAADDPFEAPLGKLGRWIDSASYGRLWRPNGVGLFWHPYSEGSWASLGGDRWLWIGQEPWDWATGHYGRWVHLPSVGWAWQPGRNWSPAWVAWREGAGYVGWAPLPAVPRIGGAITPRDEDIPDQGWVFVREAGFLHPNMGEIAMPQVNNRQLLNASSPIRNAPGPSVDQISKATHRKVAQARVIDAPHPGSPDINRDAVVIPLYRPIAEDGIPGTTEADAAAQAPQPKAAGPTPPMIARPVGPTAPAAPRTSGVTILRGAPATITPPAPQGDGYITPDAQAQTGYDNGGGTSLYVGPDTRYVPVYPSPGQYPPPGPPPRVTPPNVIVPPGSPRPPPGSPLFGGPVRQTKPTPYPSGD